MGALAVLPSNKCGAPETFHDWPIPPYRAFMWAFLWAFLSVSEGEIGRKSVENVQRNARGTTSKMTE
jgi:hypothetical protein